MTVANLPLTAENVLFILRVLIGRTIVRLSLNSRPFDPSFVSGDAFRSLADHIFERGKEFDPVDVKNRDIVFVSLSRIDEYFHKIHPRITKQYRLISHNGDTAINKRFLDKMDEKILIWWTQNCLIKHPKIIPIPIGLENISYYNHGIPSLFRHRKWKVKKTRILYGFSVSTNPITRSRVQKILQRTPTADPVKGRLNSQQYLDELLGYKFVASPPGNGEDCIRTWEAMYLGVIPVVSKSVLTVYFQKLGLPLLIVSDWKEIEKCTIKELERKYKNILKKSDAEPLHFAYWKSRILNTYGK